MTNEQSLFERLGGKPAVDAAVDKFYEKVMSDPAINGFFTSVDMDRQKNKQRAFLTYAFGGSQSYGGRGMREAHARAVDNGLNDTHFDAVVGHFAATLTELGVHAEQIKEVAAIAETTRADVLGR